MIASKLKGMFAYSVEKNSHKRFLRGIQYLGKFTKNEKKMDTYSCFTLRYENNSNQNKNST